MVIIGGAYTLERIVVDVDFLDMSDVLVHFERQLCHLVAFNIKL